MTKGSNRHVFAIATLVWLFVELLRGWTPLLITVFGRAAETPPELIGAFALGVTATPLLILFVLGRRLVTVPVAAPALMVVALVARLLLPLRRTPKATGALPLRRGAVAVFVATLLAAAGPLVTVRALSPSSPLGDLRRALRVDA